MKLTDLKCKNAKATGKDFQIADGGGLSLVVREAGAKFWRYEFRLAGKKQKYGFGNWPEISLAEARKLHAVARRLVELNRHPGELIDSPEVKRWILDGLRLDDIEARLADAAECEQRAARFTFGMAADRFKTEWVDRSWKSPDKGWNPVKNHLLPKLAALALDDIDAPMVRELLHDVREHRGTQAALQAHGWAKRIFGYAQEHDWCRHNPALAIKSARIGSRGKRERWLKPPEIRRYLSALYQTEAYRGYKLALHLLLMLALRKNELVGASWSEIDLDGAEWLIPGSRMKGGRDHRVFLPTQAVELLTELKRLAGGSEWVMPMPTDPGRAMNGNNLSGCHHAACLGAGIEDYHIHDHRHTASTELRELGYLPEVVEAALSHAIPGVAGVYAHSEYKRQRTEMMQAWADFLDQLVTERTVIAATFRRAQ